MLRVKVVRVLKDNYTYILTDVVTGRTAVVDPAEAGKILKELDKEKLKLSYIINTHYHWDHTEGNLELKKATGAKVLSGGKTKIPGLDVHLDNKFFLGNSVAEIIRTPGHTDEHVVILFDKILFSGDMLFLAGCGRVFESTLLDMYRSIQKLKILHNDTLIYAGHEYARQNLNFAHKLEPDNQDVLALYSSASGNLINMPSTIGMEKRVNPFFRVDSESIRRNLDMVNNSNFEVFVEIRKLRDVF